MTEDKARQLLSGYVYGCPDKVIYNGIWDGIFMFFDYHNSCKHKVPCEQNSIIQGWIEKEANRLEYLLEDFINPKLEEYLRAKADHIKETREAYDYLISIGYKLYKKDQKNDRTES